MKTKFKFIVLYDKARFVQVNQKHSMMMWSARWISPSRHRMYQCERACDHGGVIFPSQSELFKRCGNEVRCGLKLEVKVLYEAAFFLH